MSNFDYTGGVSAMVDHYIECALWSSLDESFDAEDCSPKFRAQALEDCTAFAADNVTDLADMSAEQAGHDFWLTRCGHGAGFWDRGLGAVGDRLTKACKPYGNVDLYVTDDGKVDC